MIGRFMGAFALSDLRPALKPGSGHAGGVGRHPGVPVLPRLRGCAATGSDLATAVRFGAFLGLLLAAFFLGGATPQRMLALFSVLIVCPACHRHETAGETAKWAILCVGLFCSVMWSNIFSLAIDGLGALKSQASSLLIMAILGGAVLPPIQGAVADHFGIQSSFAVPIVAFIYVAFYGLYGYRAGRHLATTAAPAPLPLKLRDISS